MENSRPYVCYVYGDLDTLNRAKLKDEFSRFGTVRKIYIDQENSYAKIYLDNIEAVKQASIRLDGLYGWKLECKQVKKKTGNFSVTNNSRALGSERTDSKTSSVSNLEMDEECSYAGEYVDIHGRTVEVLKGEHGELFVNLDDVRAAGFNIYPKEIYENIVIPKSVDLRHFENYLINQGKNYILKYKQPFNEQEVLNVFEKVRAKLQIAEPVAQFGDGRLINNTQSKNFSITARTSTPSSGSGQGHGFHNASTSRGRSNFQSHQNGQASFNSPCSPPNCSRDSSRTNDSAMWDRTKEVMQKVPKANNASHIRKPRNFGGGAQNSRPIVDSNKTMDNNWEAVKEVVALSPAKARSQYGGSVAGTERNISNIERVKISPGSTHKVNVSLLHMNKPTIFYGQLMENMNLIDEILLHVNTQDKILPEIANPERDMLCVVSYEECWYRAVVLYKLTGPGKAYVELIDYGNKEHIDVPIREMSEAMKKIPAQAIRFAIHSSPGSLQSNSDLQLGQGLEVFVKRHDTIPDEYDDFTHLVEIKQILEVTSLEEDPPTPPNQELTPLVVEGLSPPDAPELSPPDAPELSPPDAPELPPAAVQEVASPKEDCFTMVPPSSAKVTAGETVIIVNYTENKLVLRNKDTALICKEIYAHLRDMQKKSISDPKVGQLVLCSQETNEGLHRAVIKKINDKAADLEFIDYYGGETLALKSLRNVDEVLASYPSAKIELDYPVLDKLTDRSEELLTELIFNKKKIKSTLVDGILDFQLSEDDKTVLLSEKIKELAKPPSAEPKQATSSTPVPENTKEIPQNNTSLSDRETETAPASVAEVKQPVSSPAPKQEKNPALQAEKKEEFKPVTIDEMTYVSVPLGVGSFCCYSCKEGLITLVSLSDENTNHLEALQISEPPDETPHAPEPFEMCLAKFDDVWYRALVIDNKGETFEVLFVDYGNTECVDIANLRRFPKELVAIPVIGIEAYFLGVPDTKKVHDRLSELLPDDTIIDAEVVEIGQDDKYGIKISSIYEKLKQEKLI